MERGKEHQHAGLKLAKHSNNSGFVTSVGDLRCDAVYDIHNYFWLRSERIVYAEIRWCVQESVELIPQHWLHVTQHWLTILARLIKKKKIFLHAARRTVGTL
jgi:hypothetical protein